MHKEQEREDIRRRFPANHYVILDDKPRIHAGMKRAFGAEITTVLVNQGSYARAGQGDGDRADLVIESIGDVPMLQLADLIDAARESARG